MEQYGVKAHELITFHKPFGYFAYNKLQKSAFCVLSDSGSIYEEAAVLRFPAVQVRKSSERPEALDEGVAVLSGLERDAVLQSIELVTKQRAAGEEMNVPQNYRDTNVSSKIVRLIVGLTGIVKERRKSILK